MAGIATGEAVAAPAKSLPSRYPPSWVDHLTGWVRRLPVPAWLFYLGLWLVLFLLMTVVLWSDGTYAADSAIYLAGVFFPYHALFTGFGPYLLALLHYADNLAERALAHFRPALDADDHEYEELRYALTNLPARPAALASLTVSLVGVPIGLTIVAGIPRIWEQVKLSASPLAFAIEVPISLFGACIVGVLVYHTVRQLRLVDRIYTTRTKINLFHLGPLYSLSRLSAFTAVGLILLLYIDYATIPGILTASLATVVILVAIVLALATIFVWPLWGVHRLLVKEKERLEMEASRRMESAIAKLHGKVDADDLTEADALNKTISSLQIEQKVIDDLPTWPWHPNTLRLISTAVLLPILLYTIERILARLVGF